MNLNSKIINNEFPLLSSSSRGTDSMYSFDSLSMLP